MSDNPFNTPRGKSETPYWLRNGLPERAEIDRHEAEHRRRLGMRDQAYGVTDRQRFDTWVLSQYGVVGENRRQMMWAAWQAAQRS
jgi:hypothetical protein